MAYIYRQGVHLPLKILTLERLLLYRGNTTFVTLFPTLGLKYDSSSKRRAHGPILSPLTVFIGFNDKSGPFRPNKFLLLLLKIRSENLLCLLSSTLRWFNRDCSLRKVVGLIKKPSGLRLHLHGIWVYSDTPSCMKSVLHDESTEHVPFDYNGHK